MTESAWQPIRLATRHFGEHYPITMTGIEKAYCDVIIRALCDANSYLLDERLDHLLQPTPVCGKIDTLALDANVEIIISERLQRFDQYAILIAEERGEYNNPLVTESGAAVSGPRTFFGSDPVDRTRQFCQFLKTSADQSVKLGTYLQRKECIREWEEMHGQPASITGATSAITIIRRGTPILTVILNFITQELFVACDDGIFNLRLGLSTGNHAKAAPDFSQVQQKGSPIYFRDSLHDDEKRFVTFVGKQGYEENLRDSNLLEPEEIKQSLHDEVPGGPARVLYLSELQPKTPSIGFILANGEKITEWIHWIPFVRFARKPRDLGTPALEVFEIYYDRPYTRDGILMSTSPVYSIFRPSSNRQPMVIDIDRLKALPNPSRYRSTLLVSSRSNLWATQIVRKHGHRPLLF